MGAKRADEQKRLVHIYTGESKGKTTAAIGLAVRAVGAGWKALFCQFYKPDGSSELEPLQRLGVTIKRFNWRGNFFKKYTLDELKQQAAELEDFIGEVQKEWKHYDLVVMDEVVYAITGKIISEQAFIEFLKRRPDTAELVLTGRDFPKSILEQADYVTNMQQLKHPFTKDFLPRKGIEY